MEKGPSTKFCGILIIFQQVMKLLCLERLNVSDVLPANVHNMHYSVVHNVLEQKLIWFGSLEKGLLFFLVPFVFLCHLHWVGTLVYDEQKFQVVRQFTVVTKLERLLAKYNIFNSLILKLKGSEHKYGLRTLVLGTTVSNCLEVFTKFIRKHLRLGSFSNKISSLRPVTLSGVFL